MQPKPKSRRHFTDAARQAAAESRRRKRELRLAEAQGEKLTGVVMRASCDTHAFCWEIRRWGLLAPLRVSDNLYATPQQAWSAVKAKLFDMTSDSPHKI